MKINSDLIVYNNLSFEDNFKQINNDIVGLKGTVLYNGGTTGNITLSESCVKYDYVEIFYRQNQNFYSSVKVDNPNGKQVSISILAPSSSDNGVWMQGKIMQFNGTSLNTISGRTAEALASKGGTNGGTGNNVSITKIVGYIIN